ncbi:MAG: sigma-54-dependent Fis family transcriptional regulator [Bdellovibrionales bacterium]|nr:sigma 54-interacting transcriptional regulator [Bdellovibrionales bacterium]NQZ18782.1 sigma-54-dependent Fis family transcriptional regulator [Bdellovibrionales bacterium]
MKPRIIIIDDDPNTEDSCAEFLEEVSDSVEYFSNPMDALKSAKLNPFNIAIVFMDHNFENKNGDVIAYGSDFISEFKKLNDTIKVIMLSGDNQEDTLRRWIMAKADNFIFKGADCWERVTEVSREALREYTIRENLSKRRSKFHVPDSIKQMDMVGQSMELEKACEMLAKAAPTKHTILVLGETGTGKELSAKGVHKLSGLKGKFMDINCGQYDNNDTTLEAELFGTEKGKFTDVTNTIGLIEAANGGTLFLDEIHNMPIRVQQKLLRFLEDGSYRKSGSTIVKQSNARIVCAGNSKLKDLVKSGDFMPDLYYRINRITVELPDLNSRREDIEVLSYHFLKKFGEGREIMISENAIRFLREQDWEGNVRDLANILARVTTLVSEDLITVEHLKEHSDFDKEKEIKIEKLHEIESRHELEKKLLILKSWELSNGGRTKGGDLLGISRQRYSHMIENLKLEEVCPPKKSGKGVTKEEVRRVEELYSKLSNYFRKDLKGFLGA